MKLLEPGNLKNRELMEGLENGSPIKVESISELIDLEHKISQYLKIKWAGEVALGSITIDIKTEEFPIIVFKKEEGLWWDNYREKEDK